MNDAKVQVKITGETKSLDNAVSKASKSLQGFKSFTKGIGTAVAVGLTAKVTAATTAIIKMSKQSLQARADFEQLIGGTSLLYGEAADYIEERSGQVYKTAGMSTNQYLQQVNGFAVGLKNAMGGNAKAAAVLADKIVTAQADVVAATGASQEAVQNAFNGIMKGNFTMLDNLQLGIKPTKKGMEEIIDKVNEWNKAQGHATKYQMDNLADMQAAIVDYVKMQGLAGYAANEATDTITGSISATKAAWENFLTGTGDMKQVVEMVVNTAKLIVPEIMTLIPTIAQGLVELVEGLIPYIPGIVEKILPVLLKGIVTVVKGLVAQLPGALKPIVIAIGGIFAAFKAITTIISVIKAIKAALLGLKAVMIVINAVMLANPIGIIIALVAALIAIFVILWKKCDKFREFWINLWDGIKSAFSSVWDSFKSAITSAWKFIKEKVGNIVDFFKSIPGKIAAIPGQIISFLQKIPYYIGYIIGWIIGKYIQFYTKIWNFITVGIPNIISSIITWIKELPGKIWNILVETYNKISEWVSNTIIKAKEMGINFINNVITWIKQLPSQIWTWLQVTITRIKAWVSQMAVKGKEGAKNLVVNIVNTIKSLPSKMLTIGKNIVTGIWNGIKNAKDWVIGKVKGFAKGILKGMKDALGIHSPSKEFALIGKFSILGYTEALENMKGDVEKTINGTFGLSPNVTNSASTHFSPNVNVINNIDVKQDPLGQMVNNIKTFSGGAKNDYNYGKA